MAEKKRPCDGKNVNVCVAEGCYGESCVNNYEEVHMLDKIVHEAHILDGYPMCWPMTKEGIFTATRQEDQVTCEECKRMIAEDKESNG